MVLEFIVCRYDYNDGSKLYFSNETNDFTANTVYTAGKFGDIESRQLLGSLPGGDGYIYGIETVYTNNQVPS